MADCFAESIKFVENSNLLAITSGSPETLEYFSNKYQIKKKYCCSSKVGFNDKRFYFMFRQGMPHASVN